MVLRKIQIVPINGKCPLILINLGHKIGGGGVVVVGSQDWLFFVEVINVWTMAGLAITGAIRSSSNEKVFLLFLSLEDGSEDCIVSIR